MTETFWLGFLLGSAALIGLFVGQWAGAAARDSYWTSKADSMFRAECRGRLYWVRRDR